LKIVYYPEPLQNEGKKHVKSFLNELKNKHPDLHKKVDFEFKKIIKGKYFIFKEMINNGVITNLGKGLYELRVPKRAKGGVVRIYFMFNPMERETLILLDAELKKQKAASTETALKRMNNINESFRGK
jgi:putative component of toxin-antitoxin plasmid stabilization module